MPDPAEAELLARVVLLSADVQQSKSEPTGAADLERLLQPLLDVSRRLGTNVYLLQHKTDKSLQLLLRLLQLRGRAADPEKGVCLTEDEQTCWMIVTGSCVDVCRGRCGRCFEDTRAVDVGVGPGVFAEEVERGTEGGERFRMDDLTVPDR